MKDPREFCTCTDTKCPNHPVNHEQGCSLCILKNLSRKEIPACFFKSIHSWIKNPRMYQPSPRRSRFRMACLRAS